MKARIISQKYIYENNVTVCLLKVQFRDIAGDYEALFALGEYLGVDFIGKDMTFRGIAKCSPEDNYDKIYGEILAESRAFEKLYRTAQRIAFYMAKYYRKRMRKALEDNDKYTFLLEEEDRQQEFDNMNKSVIARKKAIARRSK